TPLLRAYLKFSQEESTINTGNSFFINDWARLTVNGLLPTIKMPGFPSNERLSLFAIALIVKPCATTVKKTNPNVNVVNNHASSSPAYSKEFAIYLASVQATTPLTPIQPTSDFSHVVKPVTIDDIKRDKGRTANNDNNTYPIKRGLKMCRQVSKFNDEASII